MIEIVPSILSADFAHLVREISKVEPYVSWLHIDVMDGHFVPNITIGPDVIRSIRSVTNLEFDVHLMIQNPSRFIGTFIDAGADRLTIHLEAENEENILKIIRKIHARGKKAGLSIKPETPVSELIPYFDIIDLILCMTVEPGFGGQKILPKTIDKILNLSQAIAGSQRPIFLQVDGGINKTTAPLVVEAGATVLVVGSAIFGQKDPGLAIDEIKQALGM